MATVHQIHYYLHSKKPFEAEVLADALLEVYRLDRRMDSSSIKKNLSHLRTGRI